MVNYSAANLQIFVKFISYHKFYNFCLLFSPLSEPAIIASEMTYKLQWPGAEVKCKNMVFFV